MIWARMVAGLSADRRLTCCAAEPSQLRPVAKKTDGCTESNDACYAASAGTDDVGGTYSQTPSAQTSMASSLVVHPFRISSA